MYPTNTHLKPVIGLDIHIVNIPFPCPLPHPYIGLVIDPFDYIPFIGASVKVNNVPRGNTGTTGMIITFVHIPFGAGFTIPPIIGHNSQNFFGSKTVQAEGSPLSGAGYMLMTCNDIGLPLSLAPGKKFKPIPSLYLPTSFCIPLQWGAPVLVGGPLVPDFSIMALLKGFIFGSFLKVFGKIAGKLLTKLNKVLKKIPGTEKITSLLCKMGFEPVDLITGRVNYEYTDFEVPGPIPIKWVRNWDSDSKIKGALGNKNQLSYDRYLQLFPEDDALAVILADGRAAAFPLLQPGDSFYHPTEKLTLTRKQNGHFLLQAHAENLYYHFNHQLSNTTVYKLSFIEDYSGFRVQLHYSGKHLSAITDAVGRRLLLTSNRQGFITSVELVHREERKVLVQYSYTTEGNLSVITDALGQSTTIVYNEEDLMQSKTDRNGQTFYWEYDSKQRCIHTWGDGGIQEGRIAYFNGYNIVTNGEGEQTTYYYDQNNLCVQETDHYGNSKFTEYTEVGQLYRQIDEEGNATGYTYNEWGDLQEIIQPDGSATLYNYNEQHQPILITYPDDTTQTYVYDEQHRLTHVNYPNGNYNFYNYNEEGLLTEINSRGGKKSILSYDEDDNLQKITFDDDSDVEWMYDAFGRCTASVDAEGKTKLLQYDKLDRVIAMQLPDGNKINLQYNAYEEVVSATDKHYHVQFEYTPMGSIKKRIQNHKTVEFYYDSQERLRAISNEANKTYRFAYNKRGEITKETGFDGLERTYQRDKAGKTIKTIRPGNRSTLYEYDVNGRIVRTEYHDGSWEIFGYDKNGNLVEAQNQDATVTIKRNNLGLPQVETQDGYTIESEYDKFGFRTGFTSSLGAQISIVRNKMGYAMGVAAKTKHKEEELLWEAQYKYNKAGQEIEKLLPGMLLSQRNYDNAGRPAEHKLSCNGAVLSWKKYRWEADDRLKSVFDAISQGTTRFKHDETGNLIWAQYVDNSIVTRHADATGNLYETEECSDRKYNSAGALMESEKYFYKYDKEGNLIKKISKSGYTKSKAGRASSPSTGGGWGDATSYEWYANGMLQKVIRPDGKQVCFKYDALGRRTEKLFNGTVTRFVWDGNTLLHEWTYKETERPKAVVDEWGEMNVDKPEPTKNITSWIYDADSFIPAAKIANGETYSIISDYLGTPKEMYNEAGEKVWEAALDIYGRVRTLAGNRADVPFRYQGQYEDVETGLYYNSFRYYDSEIGIYVSQDRIRLQSNVFNLYSYTYDTLILTDPLGLDWNYTLVDKNNNPYYHGRSTDNASSEDVMRRHSATEGVDGKRFDPTNGDKLVQTTPIGTDHEIVRGIEQKGIEENGKLLGRNSDQVRGNKINGINKDNVEKYNRRMKAAACHMEENNISSMNGKAKQLARACSK